VFRAGILASTILAACDPCGAPAEPLIDIEVTLNSPPAPGQYVHAAMYDPNDEFVGGMERAVSDLGGLVWRYTLGDCDGVPQVSGRFPVRAWLSASTMRDMRPAGGDVQATDVVDVTCTDEGGCHAARAAMLPLR
jgi:hypothetical protein